MSACLRDSQILQLVFGVTLETELKQVMEHLDACPECRQRVEAERAQHSTAQRLPGEGSTTSASGNPPFSSTDTLPAIEGYEMISRIHAGAQGVVYKAVQLSTSRTVAVKLLPHEHSATDRQKHRFEREVGLAASLRHPNIVTVYDSGLTSGRYFFAMEYIHGKALDQFLKSAEITVADKLRLFATICSAVSYAHQKGVIHRDLKPGNILIDAAVQPHVVDFGLAKSAGVVAMQGDSPFTLTSQFMGTLAYASPEQTKGDPTLIDTRSDVYALGVILYEMLTGTYPYPMNPDLAKMFHTICHVPPKPPSAVATGVGADIDTIVLRALAKEPERRYQTVAELQGDIERCLTGEPISARRDSLMYLFRVRGRRWTARHPFVALMCMVALVTLAMSLFWPPVQRFWPWPFDRYEYLMLTHFAPAQIGTPYDQIQIVAITDETEQRVDEIAKSEELQNVSRGNWRSLRALHGRLMKRVAAWGPAAFAWDIAFPPPKESAEQDNVRPFNIEFAEGVAALKQTGIVPIVTVRGWDGKQSSTAGISPEILESGIQRAGAAFRFPEHAPWRVALVVKRGDGLHLPGLSILAAFAKSRPNEVFEIEINEAWDRLRLRFPRPLPTPSPYQELRPSSVAAFSPTPMDEPDVDLQVGDMIAWMVVKLPSTEEMQRMVIPYHELFTDDEAAQNELGKKLAGKLVIVADLRSYKPKVSEDWHLAPDGRVVSGLFAHAAAIDALLRDVVYMRFPNTLTYVAALALAAALGVAVARSTPRRRLIRTASLLAAIALVIAACMVAYTLTSYLCHPAFPVSALVLSFIATATMYSQIPHTTSSQLSRRTDL